MELIKRVHRQQRTKGKICHFPSLLSAFWSCTVHIIISVAMILVILPQLSRFIFSITVSTDLTFARSSRSIRLHYRDQKLRYNRYNFHAPAFESHRDDWIMITMIINMVIKGDIKITIMITIIVGTIEMPPRSPNPAYLAPIQAWEEGRGR